MAWGRKRVQFRHKTTWAWQPKRAYLAGFKCNVTTDNILCNSYSECSFITAFHIPSLIPGKSLYRQTSVLAFESQIALRFLSHLSWANTYSKIHLVRAQRVTSDTLSQLQEGVLNPSVLIVQSSLMQLITLSWCSLRLAFTSGWIHRWWEDCWPGRDFLCKLWFCWNGAGWRMY